MNPVGLSRCSLLLFVLFVPAAGAADPAHDWLRRINHAARTLSYEGVFVYQQADQLQSMRVFHRCERGTVRERLVALNGIGREVIRTGQEVRCYLPDENAVRVEQRQAGDKGFPNILPQSLAELEKNYTIELGRTGRVANRKAQSIVIRPNDGFRYGHQLWADEASGLLLMASLVNDRGAMIEQFMFTQVNIGIPIADAQLEPHTRDQGLVWHRENAPPTTPSGSGPGLLPGRLPAGFALSTHMLRTLPPLKSPVEHLVYSDGLAVVSVFVEKLGEARAVSPVDGLVSKGAVHAFGRIVDGHRVTVIGEVPAPTVRLIGQSLAPAR